MENLDIERMVQVSFISNLLMTDYTGITKEMSLVLSRCFASHGDKWTDQLTEFEYAWNSFRVVTVEQGGTFYLLLHETIEQGTKEDLLKSYIAGSAVACEEIGESIDIEEDENIFNMFAFSEILGKISVLSLTLDNQ